MNSLPDILKSKKFNVLLVGIIILIGNGIFELGLDEAEVTKMVALIGSYIVGQGFADNGKEAQKVAGVGETDQ